MLARDRRFDGLFFTCVTSTGIYCRPICPARPPKLENCIFVATASAAQEAGFRACLRCRPDASPESPAWRGTSTTVARALRLISDGALDKGSVEKLALRLGVGERHLRRLFADHLGASPLTVAMTRRVLLAKQLVHDSDLGMTDIALASGFGSLRRFNEVFRKQFGRPPSALRRHGERGIGDPPELTVQLPYRAPYDWEAMLRFLESRAIPGVEFIEGGDYKRTLELDNERGLVCVSHAPKINALSARIQIKNLSLAPRIIARLKRLFDVDCDPHAISDVLKQDTFLAPMLARRPGLRLPGAWEGFELGVRAILGQQISAPAASALAGRLAKRYGAQVDKPSGGLTHYFPSAHRLAKMGVTDGGFPTMCAAAIVAFARALVDEPSLLEGSVSYPEVVMRLTAIRGIDPWTAGYIAMRALQESDAFPNTNAALTRIARNAGLNAAPADLERMSESWRPWRAYGALHLWTNE